MLKRFRMAACKSLLCLCLASCPALSSSADIDLETMRINALAQATLIQSVEYTYDLVESDGLKATGHFVAVGNLYRIDRVDHSGPLFQGKRLPPASFSSDFNGEHYQIVADDERTLTIRDGSRAASYPMLTPQTMLYLWLSLPGEEFRWDQIIDTDHWEAAISQCDCGSCDRR